MKCPRCESALIVVEYNDVELDWCPKCEGLWFDSGEMELVAAQMGNPSASASLARPAITAEKKLKCPECGKTMEKRLLGDFAPVVADVCPRCNGLWLDHGELEQVVSGQPEPAQDSSPIVEHLRGTFCAGPSSHAKTPDVGPGDARK